MGTEKTGIQEECEITDGKSSQHACGRYQKHPKGKTEGYLKYLKLIKRKM